MTMEKKYRLLKDDTIIVGGKTLYRIEALRDFADVKKGDKGGYVEEEEMLSHEMIAGYLTTLMYLTTLGYLAMLWYLVTLVCLARLSCLATLVCLTTFGYLETLGYVDMLMYAAMLGCLEPHGYVGTQK